MALPGSGKARAVSRTLTQVVALCCLALACNAVPTAPGEPVVRSESMTSGGIARTYVITVPSAYSSARRHGVLLAFHGSGGDAESFRIFTGLDSLGAVHGLLVVYPDAAPATRGTWALGCNGCTDADQMGIDDYRFTTDLVSTLAQRYAIDLSRIYATGVLARRQLREQPGVSQQRTARGGGSRRLAAIGRRIARLQSHATALDADHARRPRSGGTVGWRRAVRVPQRLGARESVGRSQPLRWRTDEPAAR